MLLLPDFLAGHAGNLWQNVASYLWFLALLLAGYTVVFIAAEALMFAIAKVKAQWLK